MAAALAARDSQTNPPGMQSSLRDVRVVALLNSTELFGAERANIEVFQALRSHGASVTVGVNRLDHGGDVAALVRSLGFPSFPVPFGCQWSKRFFRRKPTLIPKNLFRVYATCREVRKAVRLHQATHVHVGNPLVYSFIAPWLKLNRHIPLIYRMGDEPPHASPPNLLIWRSCFGRASTVVVNSEFVRRSVLRAEPEGATKLRLIYNRASSQFAPATLSPTGQSSGIGQLNADVAGSPPTAFGSLRQLRLLYVGQISRHKGIHHLIDAVSRLIAGGAPVRLDIIGGSRYTVDLEADLRAGVRDRGLAVQITFQGRQHDPTPFYSDADVLVVPSLFEEPAANVVLEAKLFGVPSIVYPSGGLPELVIDRMNGYVCPDRSVQALMDGVRWYLDRPERLAGARQSALEDNACRFGTARFERAWVDVYLGDNPCFQEQP